MSSRAAALARLVGDPEDFLATSFGAIPVHAPHADADRFADLLSVAHVDHIVTSTGLRAPSFRLVRDGHTLERPRVTRRARIGSRPVDDLVDVAAVHREFAAGATIVLQGLHRTFAPVAAFCRELEQTLTHPVQANAYLTPPAAQGLHLHADPHDVFALQCYGVKRWVVHPPEPDAPAWDLMLRPGDALYLPAGTRHAAQTVEQPSLHLTIGVRTATWRDALRRAVDTALRDPAFDGPLPAGWADAPDHLGDELARRLDAAARLLTAPGTAEATLEDHAEGFRRGRAPSLAGTIRDVLEADTVDDTTLLRVRHDLRCSLEVGPDRLQLAFAGRELRAPAHLEAVLRELVSRDTFAPKELDALIDEPSRLVLCRRLVREGLLAIEHRARSAW